MKGEKRKGKKRKEKKRKEEKTKRKERKRKEKEKEKGEKERTYESLEGINDLRRMPACIADKPGGAFDRNRSATFSGSLSLINSIEENWRDSFAIYIRGYEGMHIRGYEGIHIRGTTV